MSTETEDVRIPAPLPPAPQRLLAVGAYGPSHVDAEDFSRRMGNWGGASQRIGDRWEVLVPGLLARRAPWTLPLGAGRTLAVAAVLGLDADPVAGRVLQRAGVSASDLLLVGTSVTWGGKAVLRSADCKVSLDTAESAQTAPLRLQATFGRVAADFPDVAAALRRQVADLPPDAQRVAGGAVEDALAGRWEDVIAGEGLFIAPDNGFNRWFVGQLDLHRRTGAPLGRLPVSGPRRASLPQPGGDGPPLAPYYLATHLEPIEAATFLGPLAGWPEAAVVAELDRVDLERADLVVAERCWRVGVGLRGAILALRRPLFRPALVETRPDGTPRDVTPGLRQLASRRRMTDSAALVGAVAHSLDARRPSWDREGALLRTPLTYPAWMARANELRREGRHEGLPPTVEPEPEGSPGVARAAAEPEPAGDEAPGERSGEGVAVGGEELISGRALYRELGQRHRRRVIGAAVELLEGTTAGADDEALLAALEGRQPEWREASLADAALLAPRLAPERRSGRPAGSAGASDGR